IITLSGRHQKREPLVGKGSSRGTLHELCSFLYILDTSAFYLEVNKSRMYKKRIFYTYAHT
ncbi:hypothetical protein CN635_20755, partial [Priestia aryabhattai]